MLHKAKNLKTNLRAKISFLKNLYLLYLVYFISQLFNEAVIFSYSDLAIVYSFISIDILEEYKKDYHEFEVL